MKNLKGFSLALILVSTFSISRFSQSASIENAIINGVPIEMKCGFFYDSVPDMSIELDIVSENPDAFYIRMLPPRVEAIFLQIAPPFPVRYHLSWDSISIISFIIRFEIRNQLGNILEVCDITFDDPFLPVDLTSFISTIYKNDVKLTWSTTREVNNSRFEIERTNINNHITENWSKVGRVEGSGTISTLKSYSFNDKNLNTGSYKYRLKQIDFNGNFEYHNLSYEVMIGVPEAYELSQNYPNPFNPTTKIDFNLPHDANVSISVYDVSGKIVLYLLNGYKPAGYYTVKFDAVDLSGGVYFCRMKLDGHSETRKLVLLK